MVRHTRTSLKPEKASKALDLRPEWPWSAMMGDLEPELTA